jgi:hypothetical protein
MPIKIMAEKVSESEIEKGEKQRNRHKLYQAMQGDLPQPRGRISAF